MAIITCAEEHYRFMAPEAPGNLVVLEIEARGSEFECLVHRFDPVDWQASSFLHASFAATERPPGFDPVANGAVYVNRSGYEARTYKAHLGQQAHRFYWRHPVHHNGLMLVVVCPDGYQLSSVDDTRPLLTECKELKNGRMVLHWEITGNQDHEAEVSWRMEHPQHPETPLSDRCDMINSEAALRRYSAPRTRKHPDSSRTFPHWARAAAAICGMATLTFFIVLAWFVLSGHPILASAKFPIECVLALGLAMASAFLGGDAVAKGQLPVPLLKHKPVEFSVIGGVAVFVITLILANLVYPSQGATEDVTVTPTSVTRKCDFNVSPEGKAIASVTKLDFKPPKVDSVEEYIWHFGDGGLSRDRETNHVYIVKGAFNVTLDMKRGNDVLGSCANQIEVESLDGTWTLANKIDKYEIKQFGTSIEGKFLYADHGYGSIAGTLTPPRTLDFTETGYFNGNQSTPFSAAVHLEGEETLNAFKGKIFYAGGAPIDIVLTRKP